MNNPVYVGRMLKSFPPAIQVYRFCGTCQGIVNNRYGF
jgi:hypothetical protein